MVGYVDAMNPRCVAYVHACMYVCMCGVAFGQCECDGWVCISGALHIYMHVCMCCVAIGYVFQIDCM
jgi:hypothetical protein